MRHFVEVAPGGDCVALHERDDTPPRSPEAPPPAEAGNVLFEIDPPAWGSGWPAVGSVYLPTSTSVLTFIEGAFGARETATLEQVQVRTIADIDIFADAARLSVVGDAARIKEYERAQAGAEAYRDAGFTGDVPPGVASWAYAKRRNNWTAQQAAEDILAASARWYDALDGIRALRLDAKEGVRSAVTNEEVAATAATFRTTLTASMEGVQ